MKGMYLVLKLDSPHSHKVSKEKTESRLFLKKVRAIPAQTGITTILI